MSVVTRFVLPLAAFGALGVGAWMAPGCEPSETAGPAAVDSGQVVFNDAGVSYCGEAGAACCAQSGQTPNPKCDDGDETQCGSSTSCTISQTPFDGGPNGCGSIAPTSCEPLATNPTSGVQNFRMRRLILVAPKTLANSTVQNSVITNGVDMAETQCGEVGTGDFSWLLSFNTDAGTLTTGGAPPCDLGDVPSCDPYTTGYCFANEKVGSTQVGPVTVAIETTAVGQIHTSAPIPTLNIPIYYQGSIIVLPINQGALEGVTISDNGNCIGSVNVDALSAACADNYQGCSKWLTAGSLTGYITLNNANNVQVLSLGRTLCSLLTLDTGGTPQQGPGNPPQQILTCKTDANGNVTDKGNYCSNPAGPNGCEDSVWLAATFAASAVNINSGAGVPGCTGGGSTDAGSPTDSGSPADAGDSGPSDAGGD